MAEQYKILGSKWFVNPTLPLLTHSEDATIGVVAIKTNTHEPDDILEWKAYIGISRGLDRQSDEQVIARLGSGLAPEEGHAFFPWLDIEKYKER